MTPLKRKGQHSKQKISALQMAYMDYLEEERVSGNNDVWTIDQFHDLVWVLAGLK